MNRSKSEETLLEQVQGLPEEAVHQLIDFARFLRQKQIRNYETVSTTTLSASQTAHLEEEFEDYQRLYPREDG